MTMNVVGLRYAQRGNKRLMTAVVLEPGTDSVIHRLEHVSTQGHSDAMQARELRDALTSALRPFELAAAVLFEADYHPNSKVSAGTKLRLRLEGAALTAALDCAPKVEVMNGPQIGRACGTGKDAAIAQASTIVASSYADAGAAALAAKSLL